MNWRKILMGQNFMILFTLLFFSTAFSHQPRLIMAAKAPVSNAIVIEDADISKAFYGELQGEPHYYRFTLAKAQKFYLNILVPDITNYNTIRFSVDLLRHESNTNIFVYKLDGYKGTWHRFYEKYGKDWYVQGPEARINLNHGSYLLKVYNTNNQGRYSLATGETESFPLPEIIKAIWNMPKLKKEFFNK